MAEVRFGRVVGRFVSLVGVDEAGTPVEVPMTGRVTLSPLTDQVAVPGAVPPVTAVSQSVICKVVDGVLQGPDGVPGVSVAASEQPDGQPSLVQWQAVLDVGGARSSFVFEVPDGGVVDLSLVAPVQPAVPASAPVYSRGTPGGVAGIDVDGDVVDASGVKVGRSVDALTDATTIGKAVVKASSASAARDSLSAVGRGELVANLADFNVKPSNTAAQNVAGFADAAASGAASFYLPAGTYQVQLAEGQNLMSFVGRSHLSIRGDNALLVDTTVYTPQSTFTSMFLLDGCTDVSISGIRYQGPVLGSPSTQLGYQGGLFVRAINGTNGVRVDADLTNLRYGVQTGDYSNPARGGCRNLDVRLRCSMVGYPLAAYRADALRLDIDADGVHRAAYIAGCDDVRGTVRFRDQYIADKAFLLTDALLSGDDAAAQVDPVGAATTSRGSSNVDVTVIDKGSAVMPTSASLFGIILSRVDPVTFANVRVRVHTKSTDSVSRYYAGFHIASDAKTVWSRYPFNWEPHVVLSNVHVSGMVDHSAQTLSGNTQGDVYVVARESGHAATVRNFRLDGLTVLRSSGGVQPCTFDAPGLADVARLDVISPGQAWTINTPATAVTRLQGAVMGALTAGSSRVSPIDAVASGSGSPEGVVTADVGTVYVDTAVTLGAAVWRKHTGSGNTGWRVMAGDTGWRTVTSGAAGLAGTFAVRRVNDQVELICLTLASGATPASPETIWTAPAGWRPFATIRALYGQSGSTPNKMAVVGSAGAVQFYGLSVSATTQMNTSWTTTDPWPSSLPGV